MRTCRSVDLPDRGALDFVVHSILSDIAVRPHSCVELCSIRARNQALCPVMIELSAREPGEPDSLRGYLRSAGRIRKPHHGVTVGYIEIVSNERHPERRIK